MPGSPSSVRLWSAETPETAIERLSNTVCIHRGVAQVLKSNQGFKHRTFASVQFLRLDSLWMERLWLCFYLSAKVFSRQLKTNKPRIGTMRRTSVLLSSALKWFTNATSRWKRSARNSWSCVPKYHTLVTYCNTSQVHLSVANLSPTNCTTLALVLRLFLAYLLSLFGITLCVHSQICRRGVCKRAQTWVGRFP